MLLVSFIAGKIFSERRKNYPKNIKAKFLFVKDFVDRKGVLFE